MLVRIHYIPCSLQVLDSAVDAGHSLMGNIRTALAAGGWYDTGIDAADDSGFREAVSRFQEAEHLPPTGQVTPVTYCRLTTAACRREISPIALKQPRALLRRPNILILKSQRRLTLFDGNTPLHQYPVGIGKPSTPTPAGDFLISFKKANPGGMLGSRWLGLNYDTYGIHGTNQPWLIGQMISHGCIRMNNSHVEELYALAPLGTPVYIRD